MILVDTAVWIDHFYAGEPSLAKLLEHEEVLIHPFIIGELACGNLQNRQEIISLLQNLPNSSRASDQEALLLIENHALMGRGIGYIDVHLLASVLLTEGAKLWTRDKRLVAIATEMDRSYQPI
ncbi:MAG: type II toxin-antitoxin system VapC family toxin [Cyanobacteria bacterium P01_A01_bin.116]